MHRQSRDVWSIELFLAGVFLPQFFVSNMQCCDSYGIYCTTLFVRTGITEEEENLISFNSAWVYSAPAWIIDTACRIALNCYRNLPFQWESKQRERDIHTLKVFHGDVCMLHYRQPHVLDVITDNLRVFKITHVRQATRKHVPSTSVSWWCLHVALSPVLDVITDALRVFKITHVRQATRKHVPSSDSPPSIFFLDSLGVSLLARSLPSCSVL